MRAWILDKEDQIENMPTPDHPETEIRVKVIHAESAKPIST